MIANGLRVLRFTNEQVLNDTAEVLETISRYLTSSQAHLPEQLEELG